MHCTAHRATDITPQLPAFPFAQGARFPVGEYWHFFPSSDATRSYVGSVVVVVVTVVVVVSVSVVVVVTVVVVTEVVVRVVVVLVVVVVVAPEHLNASMARVRRYSSTSTGEAKCSSMSSGKTVAPLPPHSSPRRVMPTATVSMRLSWASKRRKVYLKVTKHARVITSLRRVEAGAEAEGTAA